ncbi:hypothetical protein H9P43_000769 [Blastocladiella emersonii ATCC 22665]|nr:hypothetical protein H9P43_000769 [Blastocladiella emersonii ATCC 22665]
MDKNRPRASTTDLSARPLAAVAVGVDRQRVPSAPAESALLGSLVRSRSQSSETAPVLARDLVAFDGHGVNGTDANAVVGRARQVAEELAALIRHQESLAESLNTALQPAPGTARPSTRELASKITDWMVVQGSINKTTTAMTMANTMAAIGSRAQAHKLTRALDESRLVVSRLHNQIEQLETQLDAVSAEVTVAHSDNRRLKTSVDSLRKTCEEAILHYRREVELQRQVLERHQMSISRLQQQQVGQRSLAAFLVFACTYAIAGVANPAVQLVLTLLSLNRRRRRTAAILIRLSIAVLTAVKVGSYTGWIGETLGRLLKQASLS